MIILWYNVLMLCCREDACRLRESSRLAAAGIAAVGQLSKVRSTLLGGRDWEDASEEDQEKGPKANKRTEQTWYKKLSSYYKMNVPPQGNLGRADWQRYPNHGL
jgi:hypothetical protein